MPRYLRYAILVPLSVVAFYVLFVLPDIDLGWFGGLAVLAGAWSVWYLLWATIQKSVAEARIDESIELISPGEQRAWVGLVFSLGILVYFTLHGAQMVAADGSMAPEASTIGNHIVMLIIFWVIVMQVLKQRWRDSVELDERDRTIQARASSWGRAGLTVFVLGTAVMFAFSPLEHLEWAKPMTISNLMMFGLIASSALEHSITGATYWRDRH